MTYEEHFFPSNEQNPKPILFQKRKNEIRYAIDFWKDGYIYIHTNDDAEDFKIARCEHEKLNKWEDFVPAKNSVLIGGLIFLKDWILRTEISDALAKIFVRSTKSNEEEELILSDEKVIKVSLSIPSLSTASITLPIS